MMTINTRSENLQPTKHLSKKIRNWDREAHQKETHSLSGFLLIQELSFLSFIFCIIDQKTIAIPAPKLIPKQIPSPILSKTLPKATPNEIPILVPIPINNPILF